MDSITKKAMSVRHSHTPKQKDLWQKQQDYYLRLKKAGIAKKETYNLITASAF